MAHFLMAIVVVFVTLTLAPTPHVVHGHVRLTLFNENELASLVNILSSVTVIV